MSGHMRISWFLTPSTEAAWHPVEGYPADMVVVVDLADTDFTIYLDASTANVAERIGQAFIEAAAKASSGTRRRGDRMSVKDGGPAFPRTGHFDENGPIEADCMAQDGMSLRAFIAMQVYAHHFPVIADDDALFARRAAYAVRSADALIAALEEEPKS